ncbi:LON peptidase substrate-binding domain-containing protein [Paraglaciecola chathamensis]|uniref:LON peptidase substrate-binding domain-containing protein n=1 Tax=Paraglaciecola chathamensis TaxID=368405 RepID=UPI002707FBE4|nr:LON peptidase substrate-binding domain-containing protein [Paraglaciecola chathamensis]MDO6840457.1 LON peptidase substrate-binding domain-containing protein [Paraglaciecola chathamensis]
MITLPLFPLSAHILPQGRMALRIFEPRYVRMVKNACSTQTGFGVCMLNAKGDKERNEHIHAVGTHVKVIDFDMLDDGLLGITVEGDKCFNIEQVVTEHDGLRVGQCIWSEVWQPESKTDSALVRQRLMDIFNKYPEIKDLYPEPRFDDPLWVVYRWLELLPVSAEKKQQLMIQRDYVKTVEYLTQLVK